MNKTDNNVIREDVIKVAWDIDNPFQEIVDQANEMKQNITGAFEKSADGLDDITDEAKKLKEPLEEVVDEAEKLKEPLEQAKKESEKLKKPLSDTNKEFDKTNKKSQETSKSLREIAKTSFSSIKSNLKNIGSTITPIIQKAKDFGVQLKNIASKPYKIVLEASDQLSGVVDNVKSKIFSLKNIITAVVAGATVKESVGMIVDLQNIQTQFETLLGSAEKAQKRVDELVEFAGNTPFTREEIFAASKQLQVFTGNALSTGKSLKLIGDVAAGTGQEFEDVALWVGRLYDGMKSGNKVGEMTSRLQEMGAISGEDRKQIEKLADAGGDIKKNWAGVEKIFSRYDGLMEKQSKNLGNLLLSVKTFVKQNVFKKIGEGITEGLNGDGLQAFLVKFKNWRSENKNLINNMASGIRNTVGKISSFIFTRLGNLLEKLPAIIQSVKSKFNELKNTKLAQGAIAGFENIVSFIVENKDKVITAIQGIGTTIGGLTIVSKLKGILSALKLLSSPLGIVLSVGTALFTMLKEDSANGGTALSNLLSIGKDAFERLKGVFSSAKEVFSAVIDAMVEIAPGLIDLLKSIADAGMDLLTSLDPSLKELFLELVDTAKEVINAFLPVIQDVFGALLAIIKAILPVLLKFIKSIAKLVKGFAKMGGIETLVKGFIAYKIALVAITVAVKTYNIVHTMLYVKSKLAAKGITIMQTALKLLKTTLASHPIFLAAAAIGVLVGAFTLLSKAMKNSNDPAEKVKEHIKELTENTKDFRQAIEDANPILADYDKLISSKGNTMGDIDESIGAKEDQITEVLRIALQDQQHLRDEDIKNIKRYMTDLQGLQEEKLSIYQGQQTAQISAMELELKNGGINTENVAQIIANAQEAKEQTKTAIADVYSSRLTNIENLKTAGQLTNKQYNKQRQEAYDWKVSQEKVANDSYLKLLESIDKEAVNNSSELIDKLNSQNEIYQNQYTVTSDKAVEAEKNAQKAKETISATLGNIDTDTTDTLNKYFTNLSLIKENGGQISNAMRENLSYILYAFENLPDDLQDSGAELLRNVTKGMVNSKGEAINTANMSTKEIANAVENALDIELVQWDVLKESKGIGQNIMDGTDQGMAENVDKPMKTAKITSKKIIDTSKETFGVNSPSTVFAEIGGHLMAGLRQGIIAGLPATMFVIIAAMTSIVGAVRKFDLSSLSNSAKGMASKTVASFSSMRKSVGVTLTLMKVQATIRMMALSNSMTAIFNQIMMRAVSTMQNMSSQVVGIVTQMKSSVMSVDLYSAGKFIIQGLKKGMLSEKKSLINTAQAMSDAIKTTIEGPNAMNVGSPSKTMYKIGEFVGQGKINGMESTIPKIRQTAQDMSDATVGANTQYTPQNSSTSYTRNVTSENTNFAPVFNLTISGTNDDRTMARKVKQYVTDAMDDIFSSYESKSGAVREV